MIPREGERGEGGTSRKSQQTRHANTEATYAPAQVADENCTEAKEKQQQHRREEQENENIKHLATYVQISIQQRWNLLEFKTINQCNDELRGEEEQNIREQIRSRASTQNQSVRGIHRVRVCRKLHQKQKRTRQTNVNTSRTDDQDCTFAYKRRR